MSAIQKQIDAAKYAKRIVKTVNEKVPADLRETVVALAMEELKQPQAATPATEAPANPNALDG